MIDFQIDFFISSHFNGDFTGPCTVNIIIIKQNKTKEPTSNDSVGSDYRPTSETTGPPPSPDGGPRLNGIWLALAFLHRKYHWLHFRARKEK